YLLALRLQWSRRANATETRRARARAPRDSAGFNGAVARTRRRRVEAGKAGPGEVHASMEPSRERDGDGIMPAQLQNAVGCASMEPSRERDGDVRRGERGPPGR